MAISRTRYVCGACGHASLRWEGRCPGCGEWNALEAAPEDRSGRRRSSGGEVAAIRLGAAGRPESVRLRLELGELDLVLGGGLVSGCLALLGGAPGIGKSTLLLQAAARAVRGGGRALYVSGEESAEQVELRADRIGAGAEAVLFLGETDVERIVEAAEALSPTLLCVDSVQTVKSESAGSAPGTVGQVRTCAGTLQAFAKRTGIPTWLVGHVTKGGGLAGPRTLEHLVDVVLHFEGRGPGDHRILRATKNRFGSAGEVAVFRMTGTGLEPVADPSSAFLSERPAGVSGSAVAVPVEGTRPLLTEVQALTAPGRYGTPQRTATGFPPRRLGMLLAVLDRRGGLATGAGDVYVNVVGGARLTDPAADLAVVAALISAELDRPVPAGYAFVGEVGLGGEVRGAGQLERRLREAARAGLSTAVVPPGAAPPEAPVGLRPVARVSGLVRLLRDGAGDGR